MSEKELKELNIELKNRLIDQGLLNAIYYEPINQNYWNCSRYPRIALCNIEPYNTDGTYSGVNCLEETRLFDSWIYSRTIMNTVKMNYSLIGYFDNGIDIDIKYLDSLKMNIIYHELCDAFTYSAYFNLRLTVSKTVAQNRNELFQFYTDNFYKEYLRKYINILDADILVVGGKDSCCIFNSVFSGLNLLYDTGNALIGKTKVFSIRHPSRIGKRYIAEKVNYIGQFV